MIHHRCRLPLLVLAAAVFAPAGRGEVFVQPSAWYVDYAAEDFKSRFGPALAAGLTLGAAARHAVYVEIARLPWELHPPRSGPAPTGALGSFGDGRLVPVLVSYRGYFGAPAARWRGYVGAAVGSTKASGRIETVLSGTAHAGEFRQWTTTFAAHAGVTFAFSPRVAADLGYRYLHLGDVDYSTRSFLGAAGYTGPAGPVGSFAATKAHLVTFGLTSKF